jgi:glutaredoxin
MVPGLMNEPKPIVRVLIMMSSEKTRLMTSERNQAVNVYTLPVCPNCSVLKKSLMEYGIAFEEHELDSPKSRTTLLMKGVFTTVAPVLQVGDTFLTFDDLFRGDELNIDLILSVLRG